MNRFRLIDRQDAPLVIGLVAAAVLVFERPLHYFWDAVQQVELQYHLDLLPGLTLLVVIYVFHEYRKREEARTQVVAAATEAAQARARADELQRLMTLGQALASAFEPSAMLQVLWRYVPDFAHDREFWAFIKNGDEWLPLVQSATSFNSRSVDVLQAIAERALVSHAAVDGSAEGIAAEEDICFPMVAAETIVGVLGIRDRPELTYEDRRSIGAAAAVIAIGVRNVQLFNQTRQLSLRDTLTGCYNRGYAIETLNNELRRSRRTRQPVSIVMFDVDNFKAVNDQLGHLRGDDLLKKLGALLSAALRSSDVRCRFGGDEFLIVLPDTPLAGAQQVAETLRREVSRLDVGLNGLGLAVTASLGVATALPEDTSATTIIERADAALYEAKRLGRNRFCVMASPPEPAEQEAKVAVTR